MFDQQKLFDKNRKLEEELRVKNEMIAALKESNGFYANKDTWVPCSFQAKLNKEWEGIILADMEKIKRTMMGGKLARKTQSKVQKLEKELERLK